MMLRANDRLAIKSLAQNVAILQLAWTQIGKWSQGYAGEGVLHDDSITKQVEGFLETGRLVMEAIQHDVQAYDDDRLGVSKHYNFIWNEKSLRGHQNRV